MFQSIQMELNPPRKRQMVMQIQTKIATFLLQTNGLSVIMC